MMDSVADAHLAYSINSDRVQPEKWRMYEYRFYERRGGDEPSWEKENGVVATSHQIRFSIAGIDAPI